jgi:hypothetical protein
VIAPAPAVRHNGHLNGDGFTPKDLSWILTHAPAETLLLKPIPSPRPSPRALFTGSSDSFAE